MEESLKSAIVNARVEEMAMREKIVSDLRAMNLGAKATRVMLERELGYTQPEARAILAQLGHVITSEQLTSADPVVRTRIDRLRAWRNTKARAQGVPAYRILSNRLLMTVASACPATTESLRDLKGLGEKSVDAFGTELIALLRH